MCLLYSNVRWDSLYFKNQVMQEISRDLSKEIKKKFTLIIFFTHIIVITRLRIDKERYILSIVSLLHQTADA